MPPRCGFVTRSVSTTVDQSRTLCAGQRRRGQCCCAWLRPVALGLGPGLLLPASAVLAFVALAVIVRWRMGQRREAGQTLMLYGLLWLIVYDAERFIIRYTRGRG